MVMAPNPGIIVLCSESFTPHHNSGAKRPGGVTAAPRSAALSEAADADGVDLGAAMVRDGWALAFVRYSRDYVEQEHEAGATRAGLHAHCVPP
jgi:endonuclease YncB( thermonuclease family)